MAKYALLFIGYVCGGQDWIQWSISAAGKISVKESANFPPSPFCYFWKTRNLLHREEARKSCFVDGSPICSGSNTFVLSQEVLKLPLTVGRFQKMQYLRMPVCNWGWESLTFKVSLGCWPAGGNSTLKCNVTTSHRNDIIMSMMLCGGYSSFSSKLFLRTILPQILALIPEHPK